MAHFDVQFLDKNSERYMLYRRAEQIISYIKGTYLYPESIDVAGFSYRDGQYKAEQIGEGEWVPFDSENEYWGYPECYAWFRQTVEVPQSFAGKPVVYKVCPRDGEWRHTNPQLIFYANGELIQGMDSNHSTVRLLEKAQGGEKFDIWINAHTDAFAWDGKVRMKAKLCTISDITRKLIYDVSTPLEIIHFYETDELPRVEIIKAVNEAINMLDILEVNVEKFEKSAVLASEYLEKQLYSGAESEIYASCIGHTHIDVAWLWRLRQTRDKTGRSFATVLKLLGEYPEYKFMSPQAQLYDYVKQDYPEVYEGIKKAIADGRWEAEGSMWVEADTNVTSGESLVRQFLVGKRFFKQEFGVDNRIMWLPDVFGYSAALPQIIKKSDMDYFMTTKISWNEFDKFPYDTFMWKGIDGTEVLAHFATGTAPTDNERMNFQTTYNSYLAPREVIGGWKRYSQKNLNKNYLISFGYGDGGGGPTTEMLEYGRRMAKSLPGCPKVKQEFAIDFFKKLENDVKDNKYLPRWAGELYLEFHRGTLTSQSRNKRYNRKSEILYHDVETLSALAKEKTGAAYPSDDILESWKIILLNQFHDIIPGSSIKEVYDDSKIQYEEIIAKGKELAGKAIDTLAADINAKDDSLVVFNTSSFARNDVVLTDLPAGDFALLDSDGTAVKWQRTYDGKLAFFANNVPAKGYKVFAKVNGASAADSSISIDGSKVSNKFFDVVFDANMNIASLLHKKSGRKVSPEGKVLNKLIAYEDKPFNHDAWDIKCYFEEKSFDINDIRSAELIENGPVRAVYKVVRNFCTSKIEQYFIFYSELDRIDVQYEIDWKEKDVLLKADYPVDVNATKATFDIQFGNIERSTHENTTWDFAQFEVSGHKWADLSDNSFGLSILNDCKYGWTVKHGSIKPSLLRSAANPNWAQDREHHSIVYSIYPHTGTASSSDVVKHGYSLNFPMYCKAVKANSGKLPAEYSLIAGDAANVVIETVKKAEDSSSVIVRMYETWNKTTNCTFTLGDNAKAISECNMMEEKDEAISFSGNTFNLTIKPFEIKTIKITF